MSNHKLWIVNVPSSRLSHQSSDFGNDHIIRSIQVMLSLLESYRKHYISETNFIPRGFLTIQFRDFTS
jgi:hypothetical protein